ncbi:MAG TPA: sigma factor [Actinomycetota bacterium]
MGQGFGEFYEENRHRVLRAVYACTGDLHAAEDAVSEAFTRACSRWERVGRHAAPVAWVTATALNDARSSWRRRLRRRPAGGPEGEIEIQDPLDRHVVAAVMALPERQRQVIGLRLAARPEHRADGRGPGRGPGDGHGPPPSGPVVASEATHTGGVEP